MSSVCRGFNCPPQDAGESRNASSGSADNHLPHDYDEPTFGKHDFNQPPPHLEEHRGEPRYAINPDYPEPRDDINDKIMVSTVIVLLFLLFFAVLLNVYATWFWRQSARFSGRNRRRSASVPGRFEFTGEEPVSPLNVGLDSAVLETLPIFLYKSHYFTDGLKCAVCLCEFEENETGRVLPNCGHSFHVECIDMWFLSHSTCPVCRKGAQLEQQVLEPARAEQVSVAMAGLITSGFRDNLNLEQEHTATCREEYNLQNPTNIFSRGRQKQMKTETDEGTSGGRASIPQIVIDIPETPDGFLSPRESHQLHSPNGSLSSSRSPIAGLRSLTRMLSSDTQKMVFPRSSC